MRKKIALALLVTSIVLCGCGTSKASETPAPEAAPVAAPEIKVDNTATSSVAEESEAPVEAESPEESTTDDTETVSEAESEDTSDEDVEIVNVDSEEASVAAHPVVWLGDSYTQGSLGHENDNLANAPYEKLKTMTKVPVEGHGLYGFNTHDILWVYGSDQWFNQERDPNKTYIFWVGSNDWVSGGVPNTNTAGVIAEIDDFLTRNNIIIKNYIVIGTTARYELGDSYKIINAALKDHYKEHYLDVIDVIGPSGYGPDHIHLTQSAYDAVAKAVYKKLKALKYI